MKAVKIDIKQTWIDHQHQIYREAVYGEPFMAKCATNEVIQTGDITYKEITYFPVKVQEFGKSELTTYLVKEDERKIFRDLMTIQQDTLDTAFQKAIEDLYEIKYCEIHAKALKTFRELPWYKRLFINFY